MQAPSCSQESVPGEGCGRLLGALEPGTRARWEPLSSATPEVHGLVKAELRDPIAWHTWEPGGPLQKEKTGPGENGEETSRCG